jgi:hypothetical protein
MANIRQAQVRYGTVLPAHGVFDGELFMTVVEGSDNQLYIWNANDNAWEGVGGDAAAIVAASVTASGAVTAGSFVIGAADISEAELEAIDGVTLGTSAASKVLTLDANSELDGLGTLKKEDTLIATAAVLTLNATPVAIVSAPAAGIYRVLEEVHVFLDYNSAAYVAGAGEDITIQKASAGDVVMQTLDGTLFTGTADALAVAYPLNGDASTVNDRASAAGFEITIAVGEWLTGNSPLKVRALYRDFRLASYEAIA